MGARASLRALGLVALVAGLGSCKSTSVAYRFEPSPLETLVQASPDGPILARVLVGVPGAEREGLRQEGHPLLLVRLRIENKSGESMSFDPARSVLLGSDLAQFGEATVETVEPEEMPIIVPPGRSKGLLLRYPFPRDGSLEAPLLTGINLQFELGRPSGDLEISVGLERSAPADLLRDPGPPVVVGGGYYWGTGPGWWWGRW